MTRAPLFLVCLLAGCSTHPLAGLQDYMFPGRVGATDVQPYGGVCIPQGPIMAPLPQPPPVTLQPPTAPIVAPPGPAAPVPAAPIAPVVPPAAPLPGFTPG
jgi:hypothetical protein